MEIIKLFKHSHYTYYLPKIEILIGKHRSVETWVKNLGMSDILIWIQAIEFLKSNTFLYFEQACKVITILIRFFILELNVDDNKIALSNKQLEMLVNRFEHILKTEYAYRNEIKNERIEYTLLKDLK